MTLNTRRLKQNLNALLTSVLVGTLLSGSSAHAWGEMGHQLVGAIAEDTMSPEAKAFVRGVIGIEPLYLSAVWPDQVRDDARFGTRKFKSSPETSDPSAATALDSTDEESHEHASNSPDNQFDFSPFHFCEVPVGMTYLTRPKDKQPKQDCHSLIKNAEEILINPKNSRESKMIALRYLIHVIGDIHQPFHVGNGYDRGANACLILNKKRTLKLHAFWDTSVVDQIANSYADPATNKQAPRYINKFFAELKQHNTEYFKPEAKIQYEKQDDLDWLEESAKLREASYPDVAGAFSGVPKGEEYKNRSYCAWYLDQNQDANPVTPMTQVVPIAIDSSYIERSRKIAEEQVLKAGVRLAVVLDRVATKTQKQKIRRVTDKQQSEILKDLQKTLSN